MSDVRESVGSDNNSASPQIRCGAVPCPNFTTHPCFEEPCTAHACSAKHTVCSRERTCVSCRSWSEGTWVGYDHRLLKRKQRSKRDSANRAKKAQARARACSASPAASGRSRAYSTECDRKKVKTANTADLEPAVTAIAGTAISDIAVTATTMVTATTVVTAVATTGAGTAVDAAVSATNTKKSGRPGSTTSSGKKKGGAVKSPHPSGPTGPTTRSGTVRAAAAAGAWVTATGASTAPTAPASKSQTQTKVQLKSFVKTSFGGLTSRHFQPVVDLSAKDPIGALFGENEKFGDDCRNTPPDGRSRVLFPDFSGNGISRHSTGLWCLLRFG